MSRTQCCLLVLLRAPLLLGVSVAHHNALHSHTKPALTSNPHPAAAFAVSGAGEAFRDGITIEMLRFVTPYGRGWESLVDLTPYSPALRTARDTSGDISFYSFIDTWVSNSSGKDYMYVSNTSGTCHKERHSDGNGWMLDAELVFWQKGKAKLASTDTRPYSSVTLSAGPTGGIANVGTTTVHEGFLTQGRVSLAEAASFEYVDRAMVYQCQGAEEIRQAAVLGRTQVEITTALLADKPHWVDFIMQRFFAYVALQMLQPIQVGSIDYRDRIMNGTFDDSYVRLEIGMPIFISPWHAFTDEFYGSTTWLNNSYPLKPVGIVVHVSHCSLWQAGTACQANLTLRLTDLDLSCFPKEEALNFPGFFVPREPGSLAYAHNLSRNMRIDSETVATHMKNSLGDTRIESAPVLLKANLSNFHPMPMVGEIDLAASISSASNKPNAFSTSLQQKHMQQLRGGLRRNTSQLLAMKDGSDTHGRYSGDLKDRKRVCVLAQRRHGRFFERMFDMLTFNPGTDTVILQLVITGHGWEATTEQCGEYCDAAYKLSINHHYVANITQWRDDCKMNPLGEQAGTWKFARNGWCPGSAQPGLFIDITKSLQRGSNFLALDLVVRSSATGEYGSYVDHSGFSQKEIASLIVGATLFVYGQNAVREIRAQSKALTPAELAVRQGCSDPHALRPSMSRVENTMSAVDNRPMALGDIKYSMSSYFDRLSTNHLWSSTRTAPLEPAVTSAHQLHEGWNRNLTSYGGDLDFQASAPWHLLHEEDQVHLRESRRVQVFSDLLVQGRNRWNMVNVSKNLIPNDWDRVGLRIRLAPPRNGLKIDAWDRAGSFGIHVSEQASEHLKTGAAGREVRQLSKVGTLYMDA